MHRWYYINYFTITLYYILFYFLLEIAEPDIFFWLVLKSVYEKHALVFYMDTYLTYGAHSILFYGGGPFGHRRLDATHWAPDNWAPFRLDARHLGAVSSYEEKTMKQEITLMPLSANLFRLESSILTRANRATNRNIVATE